MSAWLNDLTATQRQLLTKKYGADAKKLYDKEGGTPSRATMVATAAAASSSGGGGDAAANTKSALNSALPELDKLITRTKALGKEETRMLELLNIAGDTLAHEAKTRKAIVTELGQVGVLQQRTNANITEAEIATAKWGITQDDILNTVTAIGKEVGRNISFTADEIEQLSIFQKAFQLTEHDVASMVKMFDQMGGTIGDNIEAATDMANVARMMGVNMEGFMENMGQNMKMLNTYNFADGVKGFAKMAAQSERLGLGMEHVAGLAETVMDPEGAIDLAAQLQVIGGGFGDLADPMKLMYMATNDLEGLQDAIVGVGKEMVVVGENGELMFPPTAQRQLRDMAKALNIPKDELANMIKLQKKFESVQNQMSLDLLSEDEGVQNFVNSIARLGEGGKYEVEVKEKDSATGKMISKFRNIEDLTKDQITELKNMQKDQKKTEKQVLQEQTGLLDAINNNVGAINKAMTVGLINELDLSEIQTQLVKNMTKAVPGDVYAELGKDLAQGVKDGLKELTGAESWGDMKGSLLKLGDTIEKLPEKGLEALHEVLQGGNISVESMKALGIGSVENLNFGDAEPEFDFEMPADGTQKFIISQGGKVTAPSPNDNIIGFQGNLNPALNTTASLGAGGGGSSTAVVKGEIALKNTEINLKINGLPTGWGVEMRNTFIAELSKNQDFARKVQNTLTENSNSVAANYENMEAQAFGPLNT